MFRKSPPPNFENDKVKPEGSRVIAVSFAPQTKTTLDGLQPRFEDGKDTVLISNTNALDTCVVSVKDNKATISTNLPGPLTAVYPYKAAKMSEGNENEIDTVLVSTVQSGKFADANICMAKNISEDAKTATFENKTAVFRIIPVAGKSAQCVEIRAEGFSIANNIPTGSAITDFSTIHVAHINTDSVYVSILVPDGLKVNNLKFSDGTNEKAITTGARAAEAIAAGTLYTVTKENWKSPEADIPDGALNGVFSVSGDKKVHFSQGNLRYVVSGQKWEFYENQYSFCNTTTYDGHHADTVSLFTWGYNATSSTDPDGQTYVEGHTTDGESFDSTEDWGTQIGDGNTWRTLSTAEWQYLFNSRSTTTNTGTTNARYAKATVDTIAGIILLPDTYTHPSGVAVLTNINTNNAAFTVNTYDVTAWEAMESAGAVFLPAAGHRNVSSVGNVGDRVRCWSSTAKGNNDAYDVFFDSNSATPVRSDFRSRGYSVRLVTDVSAAPTPTPTPADGTRGKLNGHDYVVVAGIKWATQNLAITEPGNKKWKGGNTGDNPEVKVPGTNEDVIVGDYFQWGAYAGYCGNDTDADKGLLIYDSFINTKCVGVTGTDSFEFKNADESNKYSFTLKSSTGCIGISPHYSLGYQHYTDSDHYSTLFREATYTGHNDDVANIILGEKWRMPTSAEFDALIKATYWAWDGTDCGYYVFKPGQGTNGNANEQGTIDTDTDDKSAALLFFPAAGQGVSKDFDVAGSAGIYWSSSLCTDDKDDAYGFGFLSDELFYSQFNDSRDSGYSVRPVSD